jgi:hypothetical protein
MIWIARIGVGLVGLFSSLMAVMAIASPTRVSVALGIITDAPLGLNTIRADVGAFFLVAAIACAGALFRGKREWLLAPLALYGIAVMGRFLGIALEGAPAGIAQAIVIELVCVALLSLGLRYLPGK